MRIHKKWLERLERLFGIRQGVVVIFTQPERPRKRPNKGCMPKIPGPRMLN
jgi:hypothetical protein